MQRIFFALFLCAATPAVCQSAARTPAEPGHVPPPESGARSDPKSPKIVAHPVQPGAQSIPAQWPHFMLQEIPTQWPLFTLSPITAGAQPALAQPAKAPLSLMDAAPSR
jgi:hypothetical protein